MSENEYIVQMESCNKTGLSQGYVELFTGEFSILGAIIEFTSGIDTSCDKVGVHLFQRKIQIARTVYNVTMVFIQACASQSAGFQYGDSLQEASGSLNLDISALRIPKTGST